MYIHYASKAGQLHVVTCSACIVPVHRIHQTPGLHTGLLSDETCSSQLSLRHTAAMNERKRKQEEEE